MNAELERWIGTERVEDDHVSLAKARLLAATLDRDPGSLEEGSPLPAGWHLIYFNSAQRRSELGADGHPVRGVFLPPVPLPHRMWAGGVFRFRAPLFIGEPARRVSTIQSIEEKEGRSGPLVFVTVHQAITQGGATALEDEKVLVYRDASASRGKTPQPRPLSVDPDWSEPIVADEVTLFRFSALTFNSHRIHYDQAYVTGTEGYPGLIVHGPLIALLVADAGSRALGHPAGRAGWSFRYRAVQPLFCNERFDLCGQDDAGTLRLWAVHPERGIATQGELAPDGS